MGYSHPSGRSFESDPEHSPRASLWHYWGSCRNSDSPYLYDGLFFADALVPETWDWYSDISPGGVHTAPHVLPSNDSDIVADAALVRSAQLSTATDANGGGRRRLWDLHSLDDRNEKSARCGQTRAAIEETS